MNQENSVSAVNDANQTPSCANQVSSCINQTSSCVNQASSCADVRHKKVTRTLWAIAGFLLFGLAVLGAILPLLPTTPFLLAAAFCFARSSEKLNAWFKQTRLYRSVLASYVSKREMTLKAKLTVLIPVTILLGLGFFMMHNVLVGRIIVAIVWIGHIIYFGFVVKTQR